MMYHSQQEMNRLMMYHSQQEIRNLMIYHNQREINCLMMQHSQRETLRIIKFILIKEFDSIEQGFIELIMYETIVIMTCTIIQLYKQATKVKVLL